MAQYEGALHKMHVSADHSGKASYQLTLGDECIDMNALIGTHIELVSHGEIRCVNCDKKTKKSFNQGYCYRCLITLAQCDSCMIKPEKCHYHEGTCREPEWGEAHCFSDHYVYLANTGNVKIGITRHVSETISSRWIDQGASQALVFLRVKNRLVSGLVETACKAYIGDKTNWRTMLKGQPEPVSLETLKQQIMDNIAPELAHIKELHGEDAVTQVSSEEVSIEYPVHQFPDKIKSINLDKTPVFSGTLHGIKGQYLLLDEDRVINLRKYAGYRVSISSD